MNTYLITNTTKIDVARLAFINANAAHQEACRANDKRKIKRTAAKMEEAMRDLTSAEHQAELEIERELYANR